MLADESHGSHLGNALRKMRNLGSRISDYLQNMNLAPGFRFLALRPLPSGAMLACYPGDGARYVKHVDNPGKGSENDGRKITMLVRKLSIFLPNK